MDISTKNYYVLTGGPGTGKTSLINGLSEKGYCCIPEVAREIIKKQVNNRGSALPWADKNGYAKLMWSESVNAYEQTLINHESDRVFFDRGLLDTICYMEMEDIPVTDDLKSYLNRPIYKKVFILPAWEDIYITDAERKQSWDEALKTEEAMRMVYSKYGYEVIEIPKIDIPGRLKFIEENL
ncbi:AAA family ATPase [Sphingobacterium cellulitidis]|uniref:ATP-binding protein n=1 Tax=Sphingobacterium cellulitidis TaxID=1768011 RepID=A0A8H9KYP0_9SPHI|nr:AAA family ATPase [Sphingobacterium soli]MBA8985902.1 putative ATPase [Sphingobacterium soli]GGE28644.1 ATP-binding protein [Sphingobacterium soli]